MMTGVLVRTGVQRFLEDHCQKMEEATCLFLKIPSKQ